jgi:hypothetical protein
MLADTTVINTVSPSAMLPDPPPPQMNNSMKIARELDPDGILDKDTNNDNDGFVKRDGEAIDPCHTLSSSESEEEDSADANEKEMEVDNPAATSHAATPVPTTIIFERVPDPKRERYRTCHLRPRPQPPVQPAPPVPVAPIYPLLSPRSQGPSQDPSRVTALRC